MKLLFAIICLILLSGCTTVPVQQKWPQIPKTLQEGCPPLLMIKEDSVEIVNFMETVVLNYNLYHDCQIKNQGWLKWYKEQKELYEKNK